MIRELTRHFQIGLLNVSVYETKDVLGREAACAAAAFVRQAIKKNGKARLLFSAANSQLDMVASLVAESGIDWDAVEVFHVDEYVRLPTSHPESFGGWVERNLVRRVHPGKAHYIAGDAIAAERACSRYGVILSQQPRDVSFPGIGANGHI